MRVEAIGREIVVGVAAGFVATSVTNRIARSLSWLTPESLREQEPPLRAGSSSGSAASLILERDGRRASPRRIGILKQVLHYGLGGAWGPVYCLLRQGSGMTPAGAGIVTGTALTLAIDETLNPLLGITPPSEAFPAAAHLRGLVTHIAWGLAAAATAETIHRITRG